MAATSTKSPSRGKLEKRLRASESRVEELVDEVTILRKRLQELQAESAMWRRKAEKQRSRVQKVRARAEIAIAEAADAARRRANKRAKAKIRQIIADHPRAEPLALRDAPALPEPSWTVAQLRAAAREQGIAGCARMRKEQLLEVLI